MNKIRLISQFLNTHKNKLIIAGLSITTIVIAYQAGKQYDAFEDFLTQHNLLDEFKAIGS